MRLVITTDTVGGVWTFTQELTSGLLEQGHSVALVSLGRCPSSSQQSACEALARQWRDRFQYTASDASLEWMEHNKRAYQGADALLLNIIQEFEADAFHSNQFCFGALDLAIPKVITAHSDVLSWAAACRPSGLEPSEWLEHYTALVQRGLFGADAVVAPTSWMLHALEENFAIPVARYVIPNGCAVTPSRKPVAREWQAATAGRTWDEAKGISILQGVSSPIPILIAGEPEHESVLAPEAIGNAIQIGPLSPDELHALFCKSAIYLCTSIYEPFGLAPLEAALCGCALVLRDIPSLREVWGDAALYFTGSDSLSHLLHELRANSSLLTHMQAKSRRRARTYTRARTTNAYVALFSELVPIHKETACVA